MPILQHWVAVATLSLYFPVPYFLWCIKNHTPGFILSRATAMLEQLANFAAGRQNKVSKNHKPSFANGECQTQIHS
jgi:hypothetical protein